MTDRYFELGKARFVPKGPLYDDEAKQYIEAAIPQGVAYHVKQNGLPSPGTALPVGSVYDVAAIYFPAKSAQIWSNF